MLEVAFRSDLRDRGTLLLDARRLRSLTRLTPRAISLVDGHHPQRKAIEALIEGTYARVYGSRIVSHYANIMSVHDESENAIAAVGFRSAEDEPLYLEQYLKRPVEAALADAVGSQVPRKRIVEIGSLASVGRGASVFLFVGLAAYLRERGFAYAAATATIGLQRAFEFFDFDLIELATANREALMDTSASWGSYYTRKPRVVAGAIAPSFSRLERYLPAHHNANLGELFATNAETLGAAVQ